MTPERKKIAVIEDEEPLLRALIEWLQMEEFVVVSAATGPEALVVITRELPDLILLDIILPGFDGFKVIKELKKNPATARIPIVVLTNLGDDEQRSRAMQMGAADYLVKAEHDFSSIRRVIERVLNYGL